MIYERRGVPFSCVSTFHHVIVTSADFDLDYAPYDEYAKYYNTENVVKSVAGPDYYDKYDGSGDCIKAQTVFCVIDRKNHSDKPTEEALRNGFEKLERLCKENHIWDICIGNIWADYKNIDWMKTRTILEDIFAKSSVHLVICSL